MKTKLITIILVIMTMFLLSCNNASDDNDTIQLWWYDNLNSDLYTESVTNIIDKVQLYCHKNNIPLVVVKHNKNSLSYNDFVMKRNVSMAKGNVLLIEDVSMLHDIAKQHADYTKIKNYDNILDNYKGRFCIPLFLGYSAIGIENDILKYYGISLGKCLITKDEYLDVKQQMKEKGAIFTPNIYEYAEIIEYYLMKNNLNHIDDYGEIIGNEDIFKEALKNTVIDVYNDVKLNSIEFEGIDFKNKEKTSNSNYIIYDENSKLDINFSKRPYMLTDYERYDLLNEDILNMTFILNNNNVNSPSLYIYKKVTNEKIYDIANEMLDESYYMAVSDYYYHPYFPVVNTKGINEILAVDENWNYNGIIIDGAKNGIIKNAKLVTLINEIYEMIIKDKDKSLRLANSYFSNPSHYIIIYNEIHSIVQILIAENIDCSTAKAEDIINKSINNFITNFKVYYD